MGVDLGEIIQRKKLSLDDLSGRIIAIDAYNALYQFLAVIRGEKGEPLMDRQRRITSHLSGLFYRSINLLEKGVKVVYVFDGEPPELKEAEIERRKRIKKEAIVRYEQAIRMGRMDEARKYAQMTSQLKDMMVEDAKRLLDYMGIAWVQAPSEGEAQAAYMAEKGHVWAAVSQDHDSLLFGAPRLVRNLTISGRRKLPSKYEYIEVEPEQIDLNQVISNLNITREQLVDIGILIGTDFNPDGFK
ncbi:MAG: flap endonuclease-1, partial [archaeon]|nr:flap endonuclease-1 [archaeon]